MSGRELLVLLDIARHPIRSKSAGGKSDPTSSVTIQCPYLAASAPTVVTCHWGIFLRNVANRHKSSRTLIPVMLLLGVLVRLVQPLVWYVRDLHPSEHSSLGHADQPVHVAVAPNLAAASATGVV
jgi:hypothetical protein